LELWHINPHRRSNRISKFQGPEPVLGTDSENPYFVGFLEPVLDLNPKFENGFQKRFFGTLNFKKGLVPAKF
jgi:hypothetical protein